MAVLTELLIILILACLTAAFWLFSQEFQQPRRTEDDEDVVSVASTNASITLMPQDQRVPFRIAGD